jgi:flagellar hook-associated protein 3 FlgL
VAYDAAGAYQGDGPASDTDQTGRVMRTVGPQSTVQVNQSGPDVFGPDGNNLFDLLGRISASLRSPAAAPGSADLADLDTAMRRISAQQAAEGAAYQRVQIAQSVQASTSLSLNSQLSDIQDIDLARLAVQASTANVNYQAALQTTANIRQLSLLNFLH